jgi:transcriptional adapter 2-alpha
MGVIKKKTAIRGSEGGVKYVCDVCSADITATVSCLPQYSSPGTRQDLC